MSSSFDFLFGGGGVLKDPYNYHQDTLMIDFSQITHSVFRAMYKPTDKVEPIDLKYSFLNTLRSHIVKYKRQYPNVFIAVDHKNVWRKDKAYYYKKKRDADKIKEGYDFDMFFEVSNQLSDELKENFPYYVAKVKGLEADDIISYVIRRTSPTNKIMLVSGDGDFPQLHNENVTQYSPVLKDLVKFKNGSAYGDLIMKIMRGDKSDSIANIASRSDFFITKVEGERAKAIYQKMIDAVVEAESDEEIEKILGETMYKRFQENKLLVDLTLTPQYYIDDLELLLENYTKGNINKVFNYLSSSGMGKMLPQINDF